MAVIQDLGASTRPATDHKADGGLPRALDLVDVGQSRRTHQRTELLAIGNRPARAQDTQAGDGIGERLLRSCEAPEEQPRAWLERVVHVLQRGRDNGRRHKRARQPRHVKPGAVIEILNARGPQFDAIGDVA